MQLLCVSDPLTVTETDKLSHTWHCLGARGKHKHITALRRLYERTPPKSRTKRLADVNIADTAAKSAAAAPTTASKQTAAEEDEGGENGGKEGEYGSNDGGSDDGGGGSDEEAGAGADAFPVGCDTAVYQRVLEARSRRVPLEEQRAELKRAIERHQHELEALAKKEKVIGAALEAAEREIQLFQLLKQQKLNEIDVVTMLRLSQLQCVHGNEFPEDFSSCIVFSNAGLARLGRRINELKADLTALETSQRTLRNEGQALRKKQAGERKGTEGARAGVH